MSSGELVLIGGSVYAIAIAWTRLYLGVHYQARYFSRMDGFSRLGNWS
ncbi:MULTISPECIES: hypothetical protein [unclassified Chroococcidiopsis]|nr:MULTISPECIES: hypothetical protein [Chroococcidiopsis]URD52618.1 hypothetical protein M5J74_11610 [Chroococcidiopsis sp. CCNUC1]